MIRSARGAWLMVAAYALLILGVSSIPADSMPRSSTLWRWDKAVHAIEYAIAAVLLFRALRLSGMVRLVVGALVCGLVWSTFGILDELYQSTVPGRDSSAFDVIADTVGASFASIASAVFYFRRRSSHVSHSQL